MKKFVFILFLLCGVNLLWAYDSEDEFIQDLNACENKDKQACKRLISFFEPRCNDKSLSKEVRGYACSVVGAAYSSNKEYRKAASFSQKGCDLNDAVGCGILGSVFAIGGGGVKQNKAKAKEYYGKACDLGEQAGCDAYKILNSI